MRRSAVQEHLDAPVFRRHRRRRLRLVHQDDVRTIVSVDIRYAEIVVALRGDHQTLERHAFETALSIAEKQKIMSGNAKALYGLQ